MNIDFSQTKNYILLFRRYLHFVIVIETSENQSVIRFLYFNKNDATLYFISIHFIYYLVGTPEILKMSLYYVHLRKSEKEIRGDLGLLGTY